MLLQFIYTFFYICIGFSLLACTPKVHSVEDIPIETSSKEKTLSQAIDTQNLVLADQLYLKYRGDHPDAKDLPTYMLALSDAHMKKKEYLLARYYAESYISNFSAEDDIDKAWFFRIKSLYLRYRENTGSQRLADQLKNEIDTFLSHYDKSKFRDDVKKFKEISQKMIKTKNKEIAEAYDRMGKHKAADYYRNK